MPSICGTARTESDKTEARHALYNADVVKGLSPEVSNLMSRVQIPSSALFVDTKRPFLGIQ